MGFKGQDRLLGNAGRDVLVGGAGNDVLLGGDQSDNLFGSDIFIDPLTNAQIFLIGQQEHHGIYFLHI